MPELLRLLEDREGDLRVVHPPRERRAVVVAHVVELERLRAELADLAFHQVERPAAFQRVHRAPEDRAVGVARGQLGAGPPRARGRRWKRSVSGRGIATSMSVSDSS